LRKDRLKIASLKGEGQGIALRGLFIEAFQRNYESGSTTLLVENFNLSFVRPYDCPNQTQSQTEPSFGAALVAPIKAIPDIRQVLRRNSYPAIADTDDHLITNPGACQLNGSADPVIFQGIIKEVCHHLKQAIPIPQDANFLLAINPDPDIFVFSDVTVQLMNLVHQTQYVHFLEIELYGTCLNLGDVHQHVQQLQNLA
jgi:hypothetical protein